MATSIISYVYRCLFGIIIIILISPIPSVFLNSAHSYPEVLHTMINEFIHFRSITIPITDWMHESFFFFSYHPENMTKSLHSTALFPHIWKLYFLSMIRLFFSLAVGFFISLGIGLFFSRLSSKNKKYFLVLRWVPFSFGTVLLQCSVIILCLFLASYISFPYFSSLLIICSTSMVIIIQAIKKWIPFLYTVQKTTHIHDPAFLSNTLFVSLLANHKSIIGSILISFTYMECIFHVNGLFQFIVQYCAASPILITVGLLLLYIPYMLLSLLQLLWKRNRHAEQIHSLSRTTIE
ncbi:hypothetical protein V7024_14350 [Bacillus sp. JJ864]|uniref:hypothetical protein n=1 Tax=Bacillus sp. JJ864 TaxID=3122975 RepID=UPI002FFF671F